MDYLIKSKNMNICCNAVCQECLLNTKSMLFDKFLIKGYFRFLDWKDQFECGTTIAFPLQNECTYTLYVLPLTNVTEYKIMWTALVVLLLNDFRSKKSWIIHLWNGSAIVIGSYCLLIVNSLGLSTNAFVLIVFFLLPNFFVALYCCFKRWSFDNWYMISNSKYTFTIEHFSW